VFFLLLTCLSLATARAAHTRVTLILSADTARPGDTVLAGVDLKMDPGWHTYWKNPGESGLPTQIKWTLPPGITAGDIQWPLPRKLPPAEVTTYGYENEVMLIVPLKLAPDLKPDQTLQLQAGLTWLECQEQCIPGQGTVAATLRLGGETTASTNATLIESWQQRVPGPPPASQWSVQAAWETNAAGDTRPLLITGRLIGSQFKPWRLDAADFFPGPSEDYELQPATEVVPGQTDGFRLRKLVKKFVGDWPQIISGVLVLNSSYGPLNYSVSLGVPGNTTAVQPTPAPILSTPTASAVPAIVPALPPAAPPQSLTQMLFYAFIGGLILNIMPCVLPVIALKILGFVGEASSQPRRVRRLGGVYAVGVLVSFLALAGVVIGLKAAGHRAGWGIQFGNPIFVVSLTTLVLLVALNLFGLFEVSLAGRTLDSASRLTTRHGFPGAFFNGVLATALATPCTAPYLGAALGFAFAQDAAVILLIFFMVGLGLATPYVALSWNPAWLKFLPKPGLWMEQFKIAMGFPMLLTMVWLFNLAAGNYGPRVLWLGVFLVIVAFAAWIFGAFVQRGRQHPGLALGLTAALIIGGYAYALEGQLHWRHPAPPAAQIALQESADGIAWQKWTPAAVTAAQKAGHPVLVDFTADWCLTCQVNKKTSLETPAVRSRLRELDAVALLADYTRTPDDITDELSRHGRAGVPLVLLYPKTAGAPPLVLPEVLTPRLVLEALDRAVRN
jgi:thiol:disulfide interchange protein DsbD